MAKQKKSKGQRKLFIPLRGLKHLAGLLLSLVSSPNGTKITVQSPASVCTNFVNEWRQNKRSFHTRSMKHFPKVHRILMPVCGLITQRSALIHPSNLLLITIEKRTLMLNVQSSNLMCSGKNDDVLRQKLLQAGFVSLCCSGSTD